MEFLSIMYVIKLLKVIYGEKRICFDWCAIQNLFEKINNDGFDIKQSMNNYYLVLTMINVHEASLNHNRNQRFAHLGFCHNLFSKDNQIIIEPEVILERSYYAFLENSSTFNLQVERDVLDFLLNPQKFPENYIPLQKESFQRENKEFMEMNKRIRNDPRIKKVQKVNNHFSLNEFLSDMFKPDEFLNDMFLQITSNLGITNTSRVMVHSL